MPEGLAPCQKKGHQSVAPPAEDEEEGLACLAMLNAWQTIKQGPQAAWPTSRRDVQHATHSSSAAMPQRFH